MALDHLLVPAHTRSLSFKSTLSVQKKGAPQREDRAAHGLRLLEELAGLRLAADDLAQRRLAQALDEAQGMTVVIEFRPAGAVDFSKLEWKRDGIEVLAVTGDASVDIVVVHVPDGRLSAFEKRIREYLTPNPRKIAADAAAKPRHAALVDAISSFRRAAFDQLWTDDVFSPPEAEATAEFQVWLRVRSDGHRAAMARFAAAAERFQISVRPGWLPLQGRTVVLVQATRAALENAVDVLDQIAEIRANAPTADFYLSDLREFELAEWVQDLARRCVHAAGGNTPYLTLLDTGVNHAHPLLAPVLDPADLHAVSTSWGVHDQHGHGTAMAGLAAHGDLVAPLSSMGPHLVPHRLESVKLLPPTGATPAPLYGWVTREAVRKVEDAHPARPRTFAMLTTSDGSSVGTPTEWSATVDRLAFGLGGTPRAAQADEAPFDDRAPRLFVLAAGNVPWDQWQDYPTGNDTAAVQNPGQAWNALTVGACTDRVDFDATTWPSYTALASEGAMAPPSTTSLIWRRTWPFKPDVVAEGGNGCLDNGIHVVVGPESLRLLTTCHLPATTLLAEAGDTSAAAIEVARQCAHLEARYPTYWPETIRALIVNGAVHTGAMRAQLPHPPVKAEKERLLRRYGFGKTDLSRSMESLEQRPTLVLQETITPYVQSKSGVGLGKLNLHPLPWPIEELEEHAHRTVTLRITLSYFVEPNPSRRGWQSKFRYQSHGLRFAVKAATESDQEFLQRINKLDRAMAEANAAPDQAFDWSDADADNWFLGSQLRNRGSIHSDVWRGTAAELAAKSHVAVLPVGGWWKDWRDAERHSVAVRYALVLTLEAEGEGTIDLYTPIETAIAASIEATTAVPIPTGQ